MSIAMALARKGTRIIVVDGQRYRWVVSPGDLLAIVVERAEGVGQRMVTGGFEHPTVISPGLVAQAVRNALRHGWTPFERGRALILARGDLTPVR
ncbi:hypothetical protein [Nocardia sp. NPDC052566]|uniref:hypothetical protein n=1 Tax=Nocardia sp. NPDC052566 TaxID=3364330 RepID=UPI0037CB52F7